MDDDKEFYKLEYEKAADRYQAIYSSMWTIFSYLTAGSGALLGLGADKVDSHALAMLALLPFIFWWWTTYLPLDRYGNNVAVRLKDLEAAIRASSGADLQHFTQLAKDRESGKPGLWPKLLKDPWGQIRRARFAIGVFVLGAHLTLIFNAYAFSSSGKPFLLQRPEANASATAATTK